MGFWRTLGSTVCVEIVSADIGHTLTEINKTGIVLRRVIYKDSLVAYADISEKELILLNNWAGNRGIKVKVIRSEGLGLTLRKLVKRPILCFGIAALLAAACWLPSRILFVRVEGNITIPTKFIVEQANICGIRLGAVRREVRSEKMKNALLSAIPQLQWAGVNTSGCVATISVREKCLADQLT